MRDEFMITRQGKQYVLFAGLLDEAHNRGLRGIDTELIQVPDEANGNVAVIKATVQMEDGRIFSGIGDASPSNVGRAIAPHLIRMAETRAKARALRDAVNVGATALEELSDGDEGGPPAGYTSPRPDRSDRARTRSQPSPPSSDSPVRAVPPAQDATQKTGDAQRSRNSGQSGEETNGQARQTGDAAGSAASGRGSGRASSAKARKSQVDLLKTLAVEWRGEKGIERLEGSIGKPLADLTRTEADEWIDRLTPEDRE